jgi:lysophospholipase L1-like esterase
MRIWIPLGAALVMAACSSSPDDAEPTGTGGNNIGGSTVTGGSGSGGKMGTGGSVGSGGSSSTGGSSGVGGSPGTGGTKASGGTVGTGGTTRVDGGMGTGGTGQGGKTGTGGSLGIDGGIKDSGAPEILPDSGSGGGDTGSGTFDPCPASGACKILPLGDSITWGIGYDGSYRVKLFANTITDKTDITYVGKLSNGPSTVSGATFPKANEGHSGWTIQQIDDIVTGKSSDANYKGKKLVVDLAPNIILLHIGTNDMVSSSSGAPDRLGALIDHIVTDAPNALLVVSNIIPLSSASSSVSTYNKAVPGVVEKRSTAGKHVLYVDQFKDFPTSELGDGVHPNQKGYERMAGVWYTAIKSYLH